MSLLEDKSGIVMGVANKRSIAWGIAQKLDEHGADLLLSYQGERVKDRVENLAGQLDDAVIAPCNVTDDEEVEALFDTADEELDSVDFLVHAIAYAKREDLEGDYKDTSRDGYLTAQEISSYSLVQVSRKVAPLMEETGGGSIMAMTFEGGEQVFPNYNVMGVAKASLESSMRYLASELGEQQIRVNAVSAGPVRTLSAGGIKGFREILDEYEERAPLGRNIDVSEVADGALFLISDLSSGITGEILHVDAGFNIMGI
jgi:enoyl-[acyl-carrier protein] reductase I